MKYLNIKSSYGVETVDELDPTEFALHSEFRKELRRLRSEYQMAGLNVYISSRCDKSWRN